MNHSAEIAALKERIAELEAKLDPQPAEPKPGDLPPHLHRDQSGLVRDGAGRQMYFVDGEWLHKEQLMAKGKTAAAPRIGGFDWRAEEEAAEARAREGLPPGYHWDCAGFPRDKEGNRVYFVAGNWSKYPPIAGDAALEERRRFAPISDPAFDQAMADLHKHTGKQEAGR